MFCFYFKVVAHSTYFFKKLTVNLIFLELWNEIKVLINFFVLTFRSYFLLNLQRKNEKQKKENTNNKTQCLSFIIMTTYFEKILDANF